MPSFDISLPLIVLLGACSAGGLLLSAFYPRDKTAAALDRRLELISATGAGATPRGRATDESRRKRSVEVTLREVEENLKFKANKRARPSLLVRMRQANLSWSRETYYAVCVVIGIAAFLLILSTTGLGVFQRLDSAHPKVCCSPIYT